MLHLIQNPESRSRFSALSCYAYRFSSPTWKSFSCTPDSSKSMALTTFMKTLWAVDKPRNIFNRLLSVNVDVVIRILFLRVTQPTGKALAVCIHRRRFSDGSNSNAPASGPAKPGEIIAPNTYFCLATHTRLPRCISHCGSPSSMHHAVSMDTW